MDGSSDAPPATQDEDDWGLEFEAEDDVADDVGDATHDAATTGSNAGSEGGGADNDTTSLVSDGGDEDDQTDTALQAGVSSQNDDDDAGSDASGSGGDGSSDGGESDEGSDSDDSSDNEEPLLKYQRMRASVVELVKTDSVTAMEIGRQFVVIGTLLGSLHVVDFNGNALHAWPNVHKARVNAVTVDATSSTIASCSTDGTVALVQVTDPQADPTYFAYNKPVLAVKLHPTFASHRERPFCCGGKAGKLVVNRKKWFSSQDTVVHAGTGEGPIHAIAWSATLLAWASDTGVRVNVFDTDERVSFIEKPPHSPPSTVCPCHIYWENDTTLLVGWADTMRVVQFTPRTPTHGGGAGGAGAGVGAAAVSGPSLAAEIVVMFRTDYSICGVAPCDEDLALLGYYPPEEEDGEVVAHPPELRVVLRDTGEDLCDDALPIHGVDANVASDYRLCCLHTAHTVDELPVLYIMSPKDLVVAKPRDVSDHVSWAVQNGDLEEAVRIVDEHAGAVGSEKLEALIEKLVEQLVADNPVRAIQVFPKLLRASQERWEHWFNHVFSHCDDAAKEAMAEIIPTARPRLPRRMYGDVLQFHLRRSPAEFLKTLQHWIGFASSTPSMAVKASQLFFDVTPLIAVVQAELRRGTDGVSEGRDTAEHDGHQRCLFNALATLFVLDGKFESALRVYLEHAQRSDAEDGEDRPHAIDPQNVFSLVEDHALFDFVQDKVRVLVNLDEDAAITLLTRHADQIPTERVLQQLRDSRNLQCRYLRGLWKNDPSGFNKPANSTYHETLLDLLAEFGQQQLLSFLKYSQYYSLDHALRLCNAAEPPLLQELVFVRSRMGDAQGALTTILEQLEDVPQAVAFVSATGDEALWEYLGNYCLGKENLIAQLLDHIGQFFSADTAGFIAQIPNGMEIHNLKAKLQNLFEEALLNLKLREGCNAVLRADCIELLRRLVRSRQAALFVTSRATCAICSEPVHLVPTGKASAKLKAARLRAGSSAPPKSDDTPAVTPQPSDVVLFFCKHAYHRQCLGEFLRRQRRSYRRGRPQSDRSSAARHDGRGRGSGVGGGSGSGGGVGQLRCIRCLHDT